MMTLLFIVRGYEHHHWTHYGKRVERITLTPLKRRQDSQDISLRQNLNHVNSASPVKKTPLVSEEKKRQDYRTHKISLKAESKSCQGAPN